MTNKADPTTRWVTDDLWLYEIETCEDTEDHVVGIKFTLKGDDSAGLSAMMAMDNLLKNTIQTIESRKLSNTWSMFYPTSAS